jgi:hypothetical protein
MKPRNASIKSLKKPENSGFAVIFILLGLMIVGGIIVLKSYNSKTEELARQQGDTDILARAKLGLLTKALQDNIGTPPRRPGTFLFPDILDDPSGANYDGSSGTGCLDIGNPNGLPPEDGDAALVKPDMRCLGRLPWKDLGLDISLNKDFGDRQFQHDPQGEAPWYAVSANLVDPCFGKLNSETLMATAPALPQPAGTACSNTNPVHPWLTVHDATGKIISNQVAAVALLPGIALTGQVRPAHPMLGNATQYLEALSVTDAAGCASLPGAPAAPCTINNAGLSNHFVSGDATSTFNDRLIFITVQELVEQLQKRVAAQMRASVKEYVTVTGKTPWLTNLPEGVATVNTSIGLLPTMPRSTAFAPTEFSWSLTVATAAIDEVGDALCIKLSGLPDTYIRNQLFESIKNPTTLNFRSGSTGAANTPAAGQCKWKNGALTQERTAFECAYTATTNFPLNLDTYTQLSDCTSNVNMAANKAFNIQRALNVVVDITKDNTCTAANFSSAIQAPSATDVGRVNVVCNSFNATNSVVVTDKYTDIATTETVNAMVRPAPNPLVKITVSNMRFSPYIPDWFIVNGWDTSSLVALANSAAPATPIPDPCSGKATLKVGTTTDVQAIAIVGGAALSTQTRPSPLVSNYIENFTASCESPAQSKTHSATYNDTILTILP